MDSLIVDVHGVGYRVNIPLSTFYHLPELNTPIQLFTYTHVREDALQLYGFLTEEEKKVFQLLIGVSKIGPRLAINIQSGISSGTLLKALQEGDVSRLNAIPGVGRKTAERMVVELRDKVHEVPSGKSSFASLSPEFEGIQHDVVSALVNLGYKKSQAEQAVSEIIQKQDDPLSLEELLKATLSSLARP